MLLANEASLGEREGVLGGEEITGNGTDLGGVEVVLPIGEGLNEAVPGSGSIDCHLDGGGGGGERADIHALFQEFVHIVSSSYLPPGPRKFVDA